MEEDPHSSEPIFWVRPSENVYSYFLFIGPTESKRKAGIEAEEGSGWSVNWDVAMGYVLVALNFFMQSVLLYLIFDEVVISNFEWQNGIMKLGGKDGDKIMSLFSEAGGQCNDGGSLCFKDTTGYTCAPPSVQLTGRWKELDTNDDGIWTREEVINARAELKCKYVVDPVDVFDVLLNMLKERENLIWLHQSIHNGTAIHLPYFTYIMADVIMCSYRSQDMCSNLVQRGFFDAPLKYHTAPRVGKTTDSALKYCRRLLEPGGLCETYLPSTYAVWKITSQAECGSPSYTKFKYVHPGDNSIKNLLSVDYSARQEYELAQDMWFTVFKGIIIFTWLLLMMCEYRDVIKILTFCMRMPNADEFGEDAVVEEQDPRDPEDVRYRIQGITHRHRLSVLLLNILRFLLTCVLMLVGVSYLIKTNGYADLIMNGVALAFIAEMSYVLYSQVLREEIKDQTEDIKAIKVEMYGIDYLNRRPALLDMLSVVILWVAVIIIMSWQMNSVVLPVHDALQCTCLSDGEQCVEAQKYNYDFWAEYWRFGIPQVFEAVSQLKAQAMTGAPAAAASYLSISSAAHPSSVMEAPQVKAHVAGGAPAAAMSYLAVSTAKDPHPTVVDVLEERVEKLEHENVALHEHMKRMEEHKGRPGLGTVMLQTQTEHKVRVGRHGGRERLATDEPWNVRSGLEAKGRRASRGSVIRGAA